MGFIPLGEEALFSSLFSIPQVQVVADEEEAAQPAQVEKLKKARGKKTKDGTAIESITHSTALVVTCSAMKAAAEAAVAYVSVVVGSPSMAPSIVLAVTS